MHRTRQLAPNAVDELLRLIRAAEAADGTAPLSEEMLRRVRAGDTGPTTHLLAQDPAGRLVGYGQLADPDPDPAPDPTGAAAAAAGTVAEFVVLPEARGHGVGRELVTTALAEAGPVSLRAWAHGDHPGAQALARSLGFTRSRVLHQLRRSLLVPIPEPVLPAGVTLRRFRPGADDAAWLAVNARAFAGHPEQGRWRPPDLRWRQAEPWFDPAGFLLAVRPEPPPQRLLGFHWTKRHDDLDPPLGEVYILGVDPSAHGLGLGTALTLAGLHHLHGRGLTQAMLYVDKSNQAAMSLYARLGFAPWSVDVTYTRSATLPAAPRAALPP